MGAGAGHTVGGWIGDQDTTSPRLEEIERGPVFRAATRADGRVQPQMGPIRNSAVAVAGAGGHICEFGSGNVFYNS